MYVELVLILFGNYLSHKDLLKIVALVFGCLLESVSSIIGNQPVFVLAMDP